MLTIIAWMVFVPAVAWNIIFFSIAFSEAMKGTLINPNPVVNRSNFLGAIVSLALLLVPGVFLFGWV